MHLCECGCGNPTVIRSHTYIRGHFKKSCPYEGCTFVPQSSRGLGSHIKLFHEAIQHSNLCACGCGTRTRISSDKFVKGHWDAKLKKYEHGTVMCYRLMKCRCEQCCLAKLNANRDKALQDRYGFGWDRLLEIIAEQDGRCVICQEKLAEYGMKPGREKGGGGEVHVDHDHVTGKFRGVLCRSCNQGLGKFRDNPVTLERAMWYVQNGGKIPSKEK